MASFDEQLEWIKQEADDMWLTADAEQKEQMIEMFRRIGADVDAVAKMFEWAASGEPLPPGFLEQL
jgi:hypothetical protein